jgi:hypothetical protein
VLSNVVNGDVRSLDLSGNLIHSWQDISWLVSRLPHLESLQLK